MISQIEFKGYRFFLGDCSLSFVADRRVKKLLSNSIAVDNRQILKSLAIYGGNNTGKTNIVSLLKALKRILGGEEGVRFNSPIFDDPNNVSVSITFNNLDELKWMTYEFEYDQEKNEFVKERLSRITYYETGNPQRDIIIELNRKNRVLQVFNQDKSLLLDLIVGQKPLLFSIRVEDGAFSALGRFKAAFLRLSRSIDIVELNNFPIQRTIDALKEGDEAKKSFISSFVKHADLSVDRFSYEANDSLLSEEEAISERALAGYEQVDDTLRLTTSYGKTKVPSILYDSAGTKKIEAIASYVYDALTSGKTLVVDEMDSGLHFKLHRAVIALFNNLSNQKGQLLFTGHDLLLIDSKMLMRKEQIYFLSRNKDGVRMTCLGDYTVAESGLREGGDILKPYLKGLFGDIPNPSFVEDLISLRKNG